MNTRIILFVTFFSMISVAFSQEKDTLQVAKKENVSFKKRVLETTEIDVLTSYYTQDGANAAVTGGIGTEQLDDFATNITVSIPLNDDDVFSVDVTISAYTSASSSNLNPFYNPIVQTSSGGGDDDDDGEDDDDKSTGSKTSKNLWAAATGASTPTTTTGSDIIGTPWAASSGASYQDVWVSGVLGYSHSSDNRNTILDAHVSFANEFDYTSFGFGGGITKLFNEKNTEIGIKAGVYLDTWKPVYPTEIKTYIRTDGNLNADFFNGVPIFNQQGVSINKSGIFAWSPVNNQLVDDNARNTYSVSLSFSQILSKNLQISIFSDIEQQQGWLSNPMQRVYFADKDNFYIGNAASIPNYTSPTNKDVFQLADDIERLPDTRLKIPVGARAHYYVNENLTLKTYYRYYSDDWGINSHTLSVEMPIKLAYGKYTLYPNYRYYTQTASSYFAPYEQHLSSERYYTSDYDLSEYNSQQFGFGFKYTDILGEEGFKLMMFGLKSIEFHYNYYDRSTGLNAHIVNLGLKFVME